MRPPKSIDLAKATKPQLIAKLRELAEYIKHCAEVVRRADAEIEELKAQNEMTTKHAAQQALEMMKQDMFYSEEIEKLNARFDGLAASLGRIETALTTQSAKS